MKKLKVFVHRPILALAATIPLLAGCQKDDSVSNQTSAPSPASNIPALSPEPTTSVPASIPASASDTPPPAPDPATHVTTFPAILETTFPLTTSAENTPIPVASPTELDRLPLPVRNNLVAIRHQLDQAPTFQSDDAQQVAQRVEGLRTSLTSLITTLRNTPNLTPTQQEYLAGYEEGHFATLLADLQKATNLIHYQTAVSDFKQAIGAFERAMLDAAPPASTPSPTQ